MSKTCRAICVAAACAAMAAAPAPLVDKRGDVVGKAELDRSEIRLSGEVRLTVTIEAPGPLTVTPPKTLFTRPNLWRARAEGLPTREVSGGREIWKQIYRLSPLIPGKPEIAIGSFSVRAENGIDTVIDWNQQTLKVDVKTTIGSASVESLRPATGVEGVPPPTSVGRGGSPWRFAIVPFLLILAGIGIYLARRKRMSPVIRDAEWVLNELLALDLTADRCAVVLRQYLAFRFNMPAEARTTPELIALLRTDSPLPESEVTEWHTLLDQCDMARFSGSAMEIAGLAHRARNLVASAEAAVAREMSRSTPTSQVPETS